MQAILKPEPPAGTLNTVGSRTICPPGTKVVGMNRADDPVTAQDDLIITKLDVPIRDGSRIAVSLYHCTPAADERLSLLMYVHGGGFVTGSLETDDSTCRVIALRVGIAVINAESTNFPLVFKTRSTFCDGYTFLSPHINSIVYGVRSTSSAKCLLFWKTVFQMWQCDACRLEVGNK